MVEPWQAPEMTRLAHLIGGSYHHWTGRNLLRGDTAMPSFAECLYHDHRVVLAHDGRHDPRFIYANRAAQQLWEIPWADFIGMPSRLSAEPDERAARQRLLERTSMTGFIDDYEGIRIARSGRRFRIEQASIWNLIDPSGSTIGQAASFERWTQL